MSPPVSFAWLFVQFLSHSLVSAGSHHHHHSSSSMTSIQSSVVTNTSTVIASTTAAVTTSLAASLTPSSASQSAIAVSTASAVSTTPACTCGYVLSSYGNVYYPLSSISDFGSLPNGALTSVSALQAYGFSITNGEQTGGAAPDGTTCEADLSNLSGVDGVLYLTVPGGQKTGGKVSGAEIVFKEPVTGGVFTMEAMLGATVGTCQSMVKHVSRATLLKTALRVVIVLVSR